MPTVGAPAGALFVVVALAVGALTWIRPIYGLAALVLLDPFDLSRAIGPTTLSLPKAALIGFLVALAVRRTPLRPLWGEAVRPILIGAAATVAATALAATQADHLAPALREAGKAVEYLAAFAGAAVAFAADPDERLAGAAIAFAAVVVAALALVQEVTGAPSSLILHGRTFPRIAGPLEGPNQLAGYFDVAIPVLLALAVRGRFRLIAVALAVCICADVLTLSRAGILAGLVASAVVLLLGSAGARSRRYAVIFAVVAVLVFAGLGAFGQLSRFTSVGGEERGTGLGSRAELWGAAIVMWRAHPWLGVGGGNYELELPRAGVTDAQTHANSLYLQSLAEGGIVLFLATVGTLLAALAVLGRRAGEGGLVLGAFGATLALMLHQVFDLLVYFPKVGLFWWLILGAGAAAAAGTLRPTGPKAGAAGTSNPAA